MDIGRKLQEMFGTKKAAKDPASHKNPNAKTDANSGDQSTSLTVTTTMAAIKALNQQAAYVPANAQAAMNAMANTPTAANILENGAQGLNYGPTPGGSSFFNPSDEYDNKKGG